MPQETLGYVKLEWTCPHCGHRNPGPVKICEQCGAAQPEQVHFEQAAQEELITDAKEIEQAKAQPDIHCAYCGARNSAGAKTCSRCGADLTEGKARESGQVLGAFRDKPVPDIICPSCGATNAGNRRRCAQCGAPLTKPEPEVEQPKTTSRALLGCIPLIVIGVLLLIVFLITKGRTREITATVRSVTWTRAIAVEALVPVEREGWRSDIPADATLGGCRARYHHSQEEPAPNATKVCGTPYTVDRGTGYGQVVQDCVYEVYADWCRYIMLEWHQVDEVVLSGQDVNPRWPAVNLASNQRIGARKEIYEISFEDEKGVHVYYTSDPSLFAEAEPGSRWLLQINGFGDITGIEPMR